MAEQDATLDPRLVLLREHSRMCKLTMAAIDLVETLHQEIAAGRRVDLSAVRAAIGRHARESGVARDLALLELGLTEHELRVGEPADK